MVVGASGELPGLGGRQSVLLVWEVASGQVRRTFNTGAERVLCLSLSPDGRLIATGTTATTVLVWDVSQPAGGRRRAPTPADLDQLWSDLASPDGATAFTAVWAFADVGAKAVAFLQTRLRGARPADPEEIARLIGALSSDRFAAREKAEEELKRLGVQCRMALRKALEARPTPEARRRIERILETLAKPPQVSVLRHVRAVEALERIATADARALLVELANGDAETRLTREAKGALERLDKHLDQIENVLPKCQ
jgi:hypothetical protein